MVNLPNDWIYCFDPTLKDDLVNMGWQPLFTIYMKNKKVWVFDKTSDLLEYIRANNYNNGKYVFSQHVFF